MIELLCLSGTCVVQGAKKSEWHCAEVRSAVPATFVLS